MSKYGKIACWAAKNARKGVAPRKAWDGSAKKYYPESSQKESRKKGCPRHAFLGLAEEGLIAGIPHGEYTDSIENKEYAIAGVCLLMSEQDLCNNKSKLWRRVLCHVRADDRSKQHNNQMDVVVALWKNGDIRQPD